MKTLLALLFVLLASTASAQFELEGNKEGSYRVMDTTQEWVRSGIMAEPEALPYISYFSEAINKPNTSIVVYQHEALVKLKLNFKKLIEVESKTIIYDQTTKTVRFKQTTERREESSPILLFVIGAILLMVSSNVMNTKIVKNHIFIFLSAALAFIASGSVYFSVFLHLHPIILLAPIVATAFGIATGMCVLSLFSRGYIVTMSSLFYASMGIYIYLLF